MSLVKSYLQLRVWLVDPPTLADCLPLGGAEAGKMSLACRRCPTVQTRTQLADLQGDEPATPERMFASVTAGKKMSLWTVGQQFGPRVLHRNDTAEGRMEKKGAEIKKRALF